MADDSKGRGCVLVAAIGGLLVAIGTCSGHKNDPSAPAATPQESPALTAASDEKAKVCEKALTGLAADGLIRERPEANRADVEDLTWAALPAKDKRLVAAAVRCAMRPEPGDYAVIYGYRSGQRLAMAMASGVSIEGAD